MSDEDRYKCSFCQKVINPPKLVIQSTFSKAKICEDCVKTQRGKLKEASL